MSAPVGASGTAEGIFHTFLSPNPGWTDRFCLSGGAFLRRAFLANEYAGTAFELPCRRPPPRANPWV